MDMQPHNMPSQSVSDSNVLGDIIQLQNIAGDVSIRMTKPSYSLKQFPEPRVISVEDARNQPSRLLSSSVETVPFAGRTQELEQLARWLNESTSTSVTLMHATGGQGKSRLAAQFARMCRDWGWDAWYASCGNYGARLLTAPRETRGVVVVVDYADRWSVKELFRLVEDMLTAAPARVLLLARSADLWWTALRSRLDSELSIPSDTMQLRPLTDEVDRELLFVSARNNFAAAMGVGNFELISPPPELTHNAFRQVLAIHLASLAAVDSHYRGAPPPTEPSRISAYLLMREVAYWNALHAREGDPLATEPKMMGRAVYLATLTGPLSRESGMLVLESAQVASLTERVNQVLDDHRRCYPPGESTAVLEPLHPDRLGEDFLALMTPGHDIDLFVCDDWASAAASRLLPAEISELPPAPWVREALIRLIETSLRWPHVASGQLYPLLRRAPWLAMASGSSGLAALAGMPHMDLAILDAIASHLPRGRHVDLEVGAAAIVRARADRQLAGGLEPAPQAELYFELGWRLSHADQDEEASVATGKAVALYRSLADQSPGVYSERLAAALSNLGICFRGMGQQQEALAATNEAVALYRLLARQSSEAHSQRLAAALGNLGIYLWDVGQQQEALDATMEAADAYSDTDPAKLDEISFAKVLSNLAAMLAEVGQFEAALDAAEEALKFMNILAMIRPAEFDMDYATTLTNFASILQRLGRAEDVQYGLFIAGTSAAIWKRLVDRSDHAAMAERNYAKALVILGHFWAMADRREEAIAVVDEAALIYRRLASMSKTQTEDEDQLHAALNFLATQRDQ
jgi:tetratricopeptide (TPR) repeat protein